MSSSSWLSSLLSAQSSRHYYVEYGGFLSNHAKHAAVAMVGIGVDKTIVEEYVNKYCNEKLEEVGPDTSNPLSKTMQEQQETAFVDESGTDVDHLLGQRKGFLRLLDYYEDKLKNKHNGCLPSLIEHDLLLSGLYKGMLASLLHGLIHAGYGMAVPHAETVCEGLAYLHHSYLQFEFDVGEDSSPDRFGQGDSDIFQVLSQLRLDDALYDAMLTGAEELKSTLFLSNAQLRLRSLVKHGSKMRSYVLRLEIAPSFLSTAAAMSDWVVDAAVRVYQAAETNNNFLLLHGVTAAWALRNLIKEVENTNSLLDVLVTFTMSLFSVYVAADRPTLDPLRLGVARHAHLDHEPTWNDIVDMAKDLNKENTDEHIYKLVQVCRDVGQGKKSKQDEIMYKAAAITAITHPNFS